MSAKNEDRTKFTTTLKPSTIKKLEEIKINIKTDKRIRGLNEVIELIVDEKWGDVFNDTDSEERKQGR